MADNLLSPLGPLFGPNFITIQQNDETGRTHHLQIYPDANNQSLRAQGMRTHYYFVPERVYLAKKQTAPADFDFGMTVFKGLMTPEDTLGITDNMTSSGSVEAGGAFCSFATTFAISDSVLQGAIEQLRQRENIPPDQPRPELGMVSIVENTVSIEIPELVNVGPTKMPFFISAQGSGKGSLEASGISAFLVTCNQPAAGAIAGSLKNGKSPFIVHYNLKQQFYINACQVEVIVDVDKVFEQFSGALSAGGFLGIDSVSLAAAYQSTVTEGGISTRITMNGASIDDATKKLIENQTEEMRKVAMDLVKKEIFDFTPTPDAPASTERNFFSSLFGGFSVSMKANYQKRSLKFTQSFELNGTIAVFDTKAGTLNDFEPAIRADLDKYLSIVDIGEFFRKVQVAAITNVNWEETLPDGTKLGDPISTIQIEVGYPDFNNPLGPDGLVSLQFRGQGFHYITGQKDPARPLELASWNGTANGKEVINLDFLKLQNSLPDWDKNDVMIRKTIVYDPSDPRVELSNGGSVIVKEFKSKSHTPVMTPDEVGYIFVKFMLDRRLPSEGISATLKCKIGGRTDLINIDGKNQTGAIWEIFSDKYTNETSMTYELEFTAIGPGFTDEPIFFSTSAPVKVDLPTGRIKYINPVKLKIPSLSTDQIAKINDYQRRFAAPIT